MRYRIEIKHVAEVDATSKADALQQVMTTFNPLSAEVTVIQLDAMGTLTGDGDGRRDARVHGQV